MNEQYFEQTNKPQGRSYVVTLLLTVCLGVFGIHRFYTGYVWIGIIQLLTCGCGGIWTLIDLISIVCNKYLDADGNELNDYNAGCATLVGIFIFATFLLGGISNLLKVFHP